MKHPQLKLSGQNALVNDETRAILNAIPQPVIIKDEHSRFRFLNDAACTLVGRARDDLLGRSDHDILPPAEADRIRAVDEHVLSSGQGLSFEETITVADSTRRTLLTQKHHAEFKRGGANEKLIVATIQDVTERRRTEEELRNSEEHYRSLVDLHPQVPWTADGSGSVLEVGPRWREITGYEPADALGSGWRKAIHPEDLGNVQRQWSISLASGATLDVEFRLATVGGGYRWYRNRAAPYISPAGTIVRWYGTLEDIDDRRRALEAARESEARFRAIADDAPVMIWVTDESGACVYHSRLWLETTGQTAERARGIGWINAIHPEDREEAEVSFEQAARLRTPVRTEYRLRRSDGSYAWVIDVGQPRFASEGDFLGYVGSVLDITDRRQAELAREESEALIRSVFESTPDCIRLLDLNGQPLLVNRAGRQLFGIDESAKLEDVRWQDLVSESDIARAESFHAAVREGRTVRVETPIHDRSGATRYMDVIAAPVFGSSGAPIRMLAIWRDVTEARKARDEAEVARLEAERLAERLSGVLESTMDSVLVVDRSWQISYINSNATRLLQLGDYVEPPDLWQLFPADDTSVFASECRTAMSHGSSVEFEAYLQTRDLWLEVHVAPTPEGISIFFRDTSERRKAEEERVLAQKQIHHMARHDALTGLPNRQFLREVFAQALSGPGATRSAALSLDLDGFKSVNDAYGHPTGDLLLRHVADRLRTCVDETDVVGRLGGDEFIVLKPDVGRTEHATELAMKIIETVGAPYDLDGTQTDIGVSVGLAFAPEDGQSVDQLIKAADVALYRAKANGSGTYVRYEPAMDAHLQARQKMKISLRQAIANAEMELHYQPLINLYTRKVTTCEALVRWEHPEKGQVSPAEFIPIAEETGLILPLGEWILWKACSEAATWPSQVSVAVNLSPLQFRDQRLPAVIAGILEKTGLESSRLQIEVTESVLLDETDANIQTLQEIRKLGVKIVMDDFGTGYSSLGYLRNFSFDKIKVDRGFITDLPTGKESLAIVRAVAGIGRTLGITTTVEGVENEVQLAAVNAEGFDEAQGYLFSRPLPAAQILSLIQSNEKG